MTFKEAEQYARRGIKITHPELTKERYMTIRGNITVFGDGSKVHTKEWIEGKEYLENDWVFHA